MAPNYYYKCNPLVAEAVGVTPFERYTWPDGSFLLWTNDLIMLDKVRFFTDRDNFLADIGAVQLNDPQAAAEQKDPQIELPEARLPEYRWNRASERNDEDIIETAVEDILEAEAEMMEEGGEP